MHQLLRFKTGWVYWLVRTLRSSILKTTKPRLFTANRHWSRPYWVRHLNRPLPLWLVKYFFLFIFACRKNLPASTLAVQSGSIRQSGWLMFMRQYQELRWCSHSPPTILIVVFSTLLLGCSGWRYSGKIPILTFLTLLFSFKLCNLWNLIFWNRYVIIIYCLFQKRTNLN